MDLFGELLFLFPLFFHDLGLGFFDELGILELPGHALKLGLELLDLLLNPGLLFREINEALMEINMLHRELQKVYREKATQFEELNKVKYHILLL